MEAPKCRRMVIDSIRGCPRPANARHEPRGVNRVGSMPWLGGPVLNPSKTLSYIRWVKDGVPCCLQDTRGVQVSVMVPVRKSTVTVCPRRKSNPSNPSMPALGGNVWARTGKLLRS